MNLLLFHLIDIQLGEVRRQELQGKLTTRKEKKNNFDGIVCWKGKSNLNNKTMT